MAAAGVHVRLHQGGLLAPCGPRGTFALDFTHILHSQALPRGSPTATCTKPESGRCGPAVASHHGAAPPLSLASGGGLLDELWRTP